ncbi:terminase gpA endonuclease subunit [Maridesulfovibrio ferrireducens]|uniref:terminase gpA endonuclease subunit n=1 Tax=Maridesulfovibrio ferrireducens TaxID=246191 RepID=UPI001A3530F4|nr:terminase gpA endonuclease subunit [Maridesulfovibrio ferrireducens]MBI9112269.1 phage terminase large subunit family protein [Maridesulfovibrio ferrireducens]
MTTAPIINFFPGEKAVFAMRPQTPTYEWACKNFKLAAGPQKGSLWDPKEVPHAKFMMDMWDRPEVRKVFFVGPSQGSKKTTIAYACALARISRRPGPLGIAMPDEGAIERVFTERLTYHLNGSPFLRSLISPSRYAEQKSQIQLKDGSMILGIWCGSEMRMSSFSAETMLIDEEDANANKNSVATAEERTWGYKRTHKIFRFTKPRKTEEDSTIWKDMQAESQAIYEYHAVCPSVVCRTPQVMEFENIKVPDEVRDPALIEEKKLARYVCPHCGYEWSDYTRDKALDAGFWATDSKVKNPTIVGFHLPSWMCKSMSLSKVMADYFKKRREGQEGMLWFDNSHRAIPYESTVILADEDMLKKFIRLDLQSQTVPKEAAAITLAIDTQKDHFWYSACAHAVEPRQEWIFDYGKIGSFEEVEQLLYKTSYRKEGSQDRLSFWRAAIDTGGTRNSPLEESRTMQVYRWLLKQKPGLIFGTKGMSHHTPGVNVKWSLLEQLPGGKKLKNGLRLYLLNADAFKSEVFWRLTEGCEEEPIWFHADTDELYIRQILSERLQWDSKKKKEVWKAIRKDNHYLDTLCTHIAMTHFQWKPTLESLAEHLSKPKKANSGPPPINSSGTPRGGAFGGRGRGGW